MVLLVMASVIICLVYFSFKNKIKQQNLSKKEIEISIVSLSN